MLLQSGVKVQWTRQGHWGLSQWMTNSKDHTHYAPTHEHTHQQLMPIKNIHTEHTCTQLRFMCLFWPLAGFSLRREKGAGKTPWWHWLTHFYAILSLMWPTGEPERTLTILHTHTYTRARTHTHTHTRTWNCLPTNPRGLRKKTTKCCWWLSLSFSSFSAFCFSHFV